MIGISWVGLRCWRYARPAARRAGGRGRLLGSRKRDSLLLIWCIGQPAGPEKLKALAGLLGMFDQIVMVTDDWKMGHTGIPMRAVVLVPDAEIQMRALPDHDWETYLARIKNDAWFDWAPDFEMDLGAASGLAGIRPSGKSGQG